jgi:protein-L-isoaspartate O-methyltransferase
MTSSATYSPDDNKLRLYASQRLDAEDYARVKAAGFKWAPQQKIFVAPMWTPDRADLLLELAGEIGDEDTSLLDRAEERADRFGDYSQSRKADAVSAENAVDRIAGGIPFGQPILVGHHSERHARRDAEKIENGTRRAIKMWETAKYWQDRAAGAIRHAKYKERPDVRHRRIKGIEADRRKSDKYVTEARGWIKAWAQLNHPYKDGRPADDDLRQKRAEYIANYSHIHLAAGPDRPFGDSLWSALDKRTITPRAAMLIALKCHGRTIKANRRWLEHYDNRLAYERAMLAEAGGLVTDRTAYPIVPGGRVLIRGQWLMVYKVNRSNGAISSVTTQPTKDGGYSRRAIWQIENIKDYQPPTDAADIKTAKASTKQPPIVNYPGDGFRPMTAAEFKDAQKFQSTGYTVIKATATHAAHRQRYRIRGGEYIYLFITDAKVVERPLLDDTPTPPDPPKRVYAETPEPAPRPYVPAPETTRAEELRNSIKGGVQVVSAPQLFPTPAPVAEKMAELADLQDGLCVLEPSAGTGNLVAAVLDRVDTEVLAYEINSELCKQLAKKWPSFKLQVRRADFLEVTDYQGCYPRILMNPPFVNGSDIKHIQHARTFLAPGGVLVSVCADGPRQREQLMPEAEAWIPLPAGSFADQGTNVNTAIVIFTRPKE